MNSIQLVVTAFAGWLVLSLLQWHVMSNRHRRRLSRLQDRYRRAQQHTEHMLFNCRQQVSELQKTLRMCHESAQARSSVTRATSTPARPQRAPSHEMDLLFQANRSTRDPYVDAVLHFADTQPMPGLDSYRPSDSAARRLAGMPEHGFAPTISFGDTAPLPARKTDVWAHERLA